MKLGFCSISALDRPIAAAATLAAAAGVDGLEVTAHTPHLDPSEGPDAARAIGRSVRAAGVDVIAYGSYLGRFGQVTLEDAEREAAIAAALGAPLLRVWAEPLSDGDTDPAPAVDLLRRACDAARADGITVVVERHIGSFADTPERIARLFDAIDRDNLALNYQVLDFLPPDAVPRQADDAARLIERAAYFHLKNYQWNPDGVGRVIPGGSLAAGVIDYRQILRTVFDLGYRGPLTIEFLAADERSVEEKLAADVAFVREVLAIALGGLHMRDARPADRSRIEAVTISAYQQYAEVMPAYWEGYRQNILATLADVQQVQQIVAEQDGTIVGTILLFPAGTASAPEVRLLAVAPTARGQGVGEALMDECIRRARQSGATTLTLHTADIMAAAMRLYARLGFQRAAELDFQPVPGATVKGYRLRLNEAPA